MRARTATSRRRGSARRCRPAGACSRSTSGCRRRASRSPGCRRSRPFRRRRTSQGRTAADDAVAHATTFGLPSGSPIYFDMEGYALENAACTQAVQSFVGGVDERASRARATSRASTAARRRRCATCSARGPDGLARTTGWIANWNGVESVFGDPYVSDSVWTNHQRVHQYKGGHKETWGGVTINIDSNVRRRRLSSAAPPVHLRRLRRSSLRRDRSAPATGRRPPPGPTAHSHRPRS